MLTTTTKRRGDLSFRGRKSPKRAGWGSALRLVCSTTSAAANLPMKVQGFGVHGRATPSPVLVPCCPVPVLLGSKDLLYLALLLCLPRLLPATASAWCSSHPTFISHQQLPGREAEKLLISRQGLSKREVSHSIHKHSATELRLQPSFHFLLRELF